jgi:hypothetical protein
MGKKRRGLIETVSPGVRSATAVSGLPPSDAFSVADEDEIEMNKENRIGESFVICPMLTFPTC